MYVRHYLRNVNLIDLLSKHIIIYPIFLYQYCRQAQHASAKKH